MKNGMKTGKPAVLLCAFGLMCAMTGCTKTTEKADDQEEDIIRIEASADADDAQSESGRQEQKEEPAGADRKADDEAAPAETEPETASAQNNENAPSGVENELEGSIKSIGEDSMVINQIFTYTTEDGNSLAVEGGGPEETLITVFFSEDVEYIVRTVKNGGVNGDSDAEDRAGTRADLQEGNTVMMEGSYEGEDFHAARVIVYDFV